MIVRRPSQSPRQRWHWILCAAVLAVAATSGASEQATFQVKDIDTLPDQEGDSDAGGYFTVGPVTYFAADDGLHGRELWRTNRMPQGTRLVKDINPGQSDSNPRNFAALRGVLYFAASDAINGCGLWRSDGTEAGTRPVYIFWRQHCMIGVGGHWLGPESLFVANDTIFFSADDNVHRRELWKSDGTASGTKLVKNINTHPVEFGEDRASNPHQFAEVGGVLVFLADDSLPDEPTLWRSDGTEAGTWQVRDIHPMDFTPAAVPKIGETMFFTASNPADGLWLWRSDGTEAGTQPVVALENGLALGGLPLLRIPQIVALDQQLFFLTGAPYSASPRGVWKSDGTAEGTIPVVRQLPSPFEKPSPPDQLTRSDGKVFFTFASARTGRKLWVSDGTEAGTQQVADLNPDGARPSIDAQALTDVNGTLFFVGDDTAHGCELWTSDGTEDGTRLDADIGQDPDLCIPYPEPAGPTELTKAGNRLLFTHNDGMHGREPYISDGTASGTMLLKDINAAGGRTADAFPASWGIARLTTVNRRLVFLAFDGDSFKLFGTDGTSEGTLPLAALKSYTQPYVTSSGTVSFFAGEDDVHGSELWRTDGTPAGTYLVRDVWPGSGGAYPGILGGDGETVYFSASDGVHGRELWRSDGTTEGTVLIKDINHVNPFGESSLSSFVRVGGGFLFAATTPDTGMELWRTGGSEEGTELLKDIKPGRDGSLGQYPHLSWVIDGQLLFFADDGRSGRELWRSDGTAAGTVLVKDIVPGPQGKDTPFGVVAGDRLYFRYGDAGAGDELWISDGTAAGTRMIKDVNPGPSGSSPYELTPVGSVVFFTADNGVTGEEVWRSDGTEAGTYLVADIRTGPEGAFAGEEEGTRIDTDFVAFGGAVLFFANDGQHGAELWRTDTSGDGAMLVKDIDPRRPGNDAGRLSVHGRTALFYAFDAETGFEPWRTDGTPEGTRRVADVSPGSPSSRSGHVDVNAPFVRAGDHIFFIADDATTGFELWAMRLDDLFGPCTGDCDGSRTVTVDELVRGVNIALDRFLIDVCRSFDTRVNGRVTVDELVAAVGVALAGCPEG